VLRNTSGGDKDEKNESGRKTEVNADACLADLRAKNNVESTVILKKDRDRY